MEEETALLCDRKTLKDKINCALINHFSGRGREGRVFGLNSARRSTRKRGSDSGVKLSVRVLRSSSTLSPEGMAPKRIPLFTKIKRDCARSYEGKNMNHVSFGAGAPRMFRRGEAAPGRAFGDGYKFKLQHHTRSGNFQSRGLVHTHTYTGRRARTHAREHITVQAHKALAVFRILWSISHL